MQNAINFVGQLQTSTRASGIPLTVAEVKAIGVKGGTTRSSNEEVMVDIIMLGLYSENMLMATGGWLMDILTQ